MKMKRLAFFLSIFLALANCQRISAQSVPLELSVGDPRLADYLLDPQSKYDFAWTWIYDYYFDHTFNGQDWKIWKHKFDGKLNTQSEAIAAIDQLFASLNDPGVEFIAQNVEATGTVGFSLLPTAGKQVMVTGVIKDSPAARVGIHYGDVITQVDGQPVYGRLHDFICKIRGQADTAVRLQVLRNGSPIDFEVVRSNKDSNPESVCTMLKGNLAYLRPAFPLSKEKIEALKTAIAGLNQAHAWGLILDLRCNVSGMDDLGEVGSFFVGKRVVAKAKFQLKQETIEGKQDQLTDIPVVALIDRTTSHMCEALAACLKECSRATLVGEKTAGQGKSYRELRFDKKNWIYIPTYQLITANNALIEGNGIEPDVQVSIDPRDVAKGPWWHYSTGGKAPSILEGSDVVLQRGIAELTKKASNKKAG